jgi:hypothetical protein
MSGCLSMSIKRSKRSTRSKRRVSPALRRQSSTVKKLAAHYRKIGKKVDIGKLGKEAAAINRGEKSMPGSRSKSRSRKTKRKTKRTKRRTSRR